MSSALLDVSHWDNDIHIYISHPVGFQNRSLANTGRLRLPGPFRFNDDDNNDRGQEESFAVLNKEGEPANKKRKLLLSAMGSVVSKTKNTRLGRLLVDDETAFNKLVRHDTFINNPEVVEFFEVRHRGVELWKKVRNYFQSKSKKGFVEGLEERKLHRGSDKSAARLNNWTIHPDSFLKFVIYVVKLLSLLYNFFYIQVM